MRRRDLFRLGAASAIASFGVGKGAHTLIDKRRRDRALWLLEDVLSGYGGAAIAAEPPILPKDDALYVMPVSLAYMRMVMAAEGTYIPGSDLNPYQVIVGYGRFTDYSDHPRQQLCTPDWCSDAAGAYQFLSSTWDGLHRQFSGWPGGPAFGPEAQDWGFLYNHGLTNGHWWLRDSISLRDGWLWIDYAKWARAVFCDSNQWASLPGANIGASTGQSTKGHPFLWENFVWELEGLQRRHRSILFPIEGYDHAALTSPFGYRRHPVTGEHRLHAGNDYGAPTGTPLLAPEDGSVVFSGVAGGYGNTIRFVPDADPTAEILMAHCDRLLVPANTWVAKGAQVATVGSTGLSTGPHLHFEWYKWGQVTNPTRYLMQSVWFPE